MAVHPHTNPVPTVQCLLALTPVDRATDAKQYMRGSTVFSRPALFILMETAKWTAETTHDFPGLNLSGESDNKPKPKCCV